MDLIEILDDMEGPLLFMSSLVFQKCITIDFLRNSGKLSNFGRSLTWGGVKLKDAECPRFEHSVDPHES